MYCKSGDQNSDNVETLQWTLQDDFGVDLGPTKVDRWYGTYVGAGLAKTLGRSNGTAKLNGVDVPVQTVYGPREISDLARLKAKKYAGAGGGVSEERAREIAEQEAREEVDAATAVVTVDIKPSPGK
jgi:hypothetical protein